MKWQTKERHKRVDGTTEIHWCDMHPAEWKIVEEAYQSGKNSAEGFWSCMEGITTEEAIPGRRGEGGETEECQTSPDFFNCFVVGLGDGVARGC